MKFAKTLLGIFLLTLLFISSCKKNSTTSDYIRGRVDGVTFECTSIYAPIGNINTTNIKLNGSWSGNNIELMISDAVNIAPGEYRFANCKYYGAIIDIGAGHYTAGSGLGCGGLVGNGRITITAMTNSYIQGTFEFVSGIDPITGLTKTVTDGEFYIKRS